MTTTRKSVYSIVVDSPRQTVWDHLTTPGRVQPFYFNTVLDTELKPGSPLSYRTENGKMTFIAGEVVEVVEHERFVHTFRFTDLPDEPSQVTFELKDEAQGTRLTVIHEGPESVARTFARAQDGWKAILGNLKALLEKGRLPLKSRVQHFMMKLFMPLMPKPKYL